MGIIGASSLYITLLLFGLKNEIPPVISISPKKEKTRAKEMSPEEELKVLKYKLEFGIITEEEYKAKGAEIISKL